MNLLSPQNQENKAVLLVNRELLPSSNTERTCTGVGRYIIAVYLG